MGSLNANKNNGQGLTDNISLQIDIDRATYAVATGVRNHIIVEIYPISEITGMIWNLADQQIKAMWVRGFAVMVKPFEYLVEQICWMMQRLETRNAFNQYLQTTLNY